MGAGLYTMAELAAASGVPARTLRQWIRMRLLPRPAGRGRAARYGEVHLLRARAVRHLRREKVSVPMIRARLGGLDERGLLALVPPAPRVVSADGVPAPPPAPSYPCTRWELVTLLDGLVLMVDPQRGPALQRIADDIFRHYGTPQAGAS